VSTSVRVSAALLAGLCLLLGPVASVAQTPSTTQPLDVSPEEAQQKTNLITGPDGFEVDLFAAPPEVNYPTAITAAPNGDLFVAVDKNGSLDRERGRGQILKVMDADGDGRAEQYTTFVDSVDSPRGLVYDGERLYVMHPPTLTVYSDPDGDGEAERAEDLVEGLGYGLDFRGADHTTNGMEMGIDGWLYIAVGDYGFFDAEGTDGRHIQDRGGGVVRVRPDGSELEIYATGLRNPYDITLDPFLNGFERGNTNDGYGWRTRLQHVVPQADYGYPSRFLHFGDEVKPPLADYGGGSGAGALYVDAPHLPDSLDRTLYTADWGRGVVYRHNLTPSGATFEPTQQVFTRIPQPTDLTIDARSTLYVSSWMGGGFRYGGEDVGFIARLRHENAPDEQVPSFGTASTERLLELLTDEYAQVRLHAQRELLRRGPGEAVARELGTIARNEEASLEGRVAALFTLKQLEGPDSHSLLTALLEDPSLRAFALRALADRRPQNDAVSTAPFVDALGDDDPRVRLEALNGLVRLGAREAAADVLPLTADPDRTVAHVAVQSLVALGAVEPALQALRTGSPGLVEGALQVLTRQYTERTVDGLIEIRRTSPDPYVQQQALTGLARLYHREDEWEREEWWGTTPSPRGPYHDPVEWAQSDSIRPVLRQALIEAEGFEYRDRVHVLEQQRAVPDGAGAPLLAAAGLSDSLKGAAVRTLVGAPVVTEAMPDSLESLAARAPSLRHATTDLLVAQSDLPASSADLLRSAALDTTRAPTPRGRALRALAPLSSSAFSTVLDAHARLLDHRPLPAPLEEAVRAYVRNGARAETVERFVERAESGSRAERHVAYAVLLHLAEDDRREDVAETARQAVAGGWKTPEQVAPLLWAVGFTETEGYAEHVQQHLDAGTSAEVQEAARYAADRLGLPGSSE